jgi:hypothetical protein
MYELKKIGKVLTSKFVGPGPSSYEKRNYRAAVSQRLRSTVLYDLATYINNVSFILIFLGLPSGSFPRDL